MTLRLALLTCLPYQPYISLPALHLCTYLPTPTYLPYPIRPTSINLTANSTHCLVKRLKWSIYPIIASIGTPQRYSLQVYLFSYFGEIMDNSQGPKCYLNKLKLLTISVDTTSPSYTHVASFPNHRTPPPNPVQYGSTALGAMPCKPKLWHLWWSSVTRGDRGAASCSKQSCWLYARELCQ